MSSSKPILIAGAGSVGQAFAGLLAHCGEPVTLLASKRTAASLRAAGGIRLAGHLDEVITVADPPAQEGTVGLLDEPGQVTEAQGIIFTSKGQDLPGLARSLGHVNTGWALGLQNGVVKNDVLAAVFGESKVLGAATMIIAARQEDGQIALASPAITFVGELSGEKSQRVEDLASRLNRAGITAVIPDDIRSVEWTKACNAAGAFAVAALTRTPMVQMMRNRDYARAFLSLAQEVAAIAAAYGVEVREHQGLTVGGFVTLPLDEAVDAMLEHR
ncbi:MAG TPA: 2-dehydropantoate 2-reductase N-terminal domain-containing protein, partial [Dehalococcoidia bacterium]|nr:2-dehydropantoate 2-reductase N-terminal domain-containing protein [Dehalococcoidia bacterium]